jgi:hypothetical protein
MENLATYSEARSEYTKQLATFIVPSLVGWFQQLWSRNASDRGRCMALFQSECEEIPRWNSDRIHDEVRVLIERTGCDYMEELMTAVFIAHTKVLTAVRLGKKQAELSITVPKLDHFIHRVFREAARAFWKAPFLFSDSVPVIERQKNVLQIEALSTEAITTAVRSMLPVKEILQRYLEGDSEEIDEEEAEVVPAAVPATMVEEEKPEPAPAPEEIKPVIEAPKDVSSGAATEAVPAVVNIDTEPSVTFADYDTVFDEKKGRPEMRYAPKEEDDDDLFAAAADAPLEISGEATPLDLDDAEDLDAPAKPTAPPAAPAKVIKEDIDTDEFISLD